MNVILVDSNEVDIILTRAEVATLREALADAEAYRWQVASSCPRNCLERGQACDDCAPAQELAGEYEQLDGKLAGQEHRRYPYRTPDDVDVKGDLL